MKYIGVWSPPEPVVIVVDIARNIAVPLYIVTDLFNMLNVPAPVKFR
ncbi:Uncharacterised protein [uncultured archaeon]|nr:Uncharacterised protein [uncultured archaeon]